jgi:hypothetical protein
VANSDKNYQTGYCKPPRQTQFAKGRSGNPEGRPKGSQNLATILNKAGRQRVRVTENGRTRYITKLEASTLQLVNKAVSGDLKAIKELLSYCLQLLPGELNALTASVPHESDVAVIANIRARILESEEPTPPGGSDSLSKEEKE